MEIINLLGSFNKISLIAFLITLVFLIYEIYLFKKEANKKHKPIIPAFKDTQSNILQKNTNATILIRDEKNNLKKSNNYPIFLSVILLLLFGLISIISFFIPKTSNIKEKSNFSSTNVVISKGLKVYNEKWQELNDQQIKTLKPSNKILIGIESITDTDINRARIRVNSNIWNIDNITLEYDKNKNIYYKEYIVATEDAILKIEAQLHSEKDGWLGE